MSVVVPNFSDYRTVGEAAAFLGVSTATLRNWDRSGKLKPHRHPHNGYRIYLREDLEALLQYAKTSKLDHSAEITAGDQTELSDTDHFVQFYETDAFLVEAVSRFIGDALSTDEASVVIATPAHRDAIHRKLAEYEIDIGHARAVGRYIVLDAAETLSDFMKAGMPDGQCFTNLVGGTIAQLAEGGRPVRAFGEMVALLWASGQREAAIRLEELWNELGRVHRFTLFCAYPIKDFGTTDDSLDGVCACHTRVLPAESYSAIVDLDERLTAVARLQQKAKWLEAEITHRGEVEKTLKAREKELADFFENAIEGIHKVGADGTILWANKAECHMLGYEPEEYIGRSIKDVHADADVIDTILQKLAAGETLENYPARLRCKDRSVKHVLISSNACFEDGEFCYTRCFTRDVTEQWHAEQALREADRRKDAFLATLAHELRNPLAPIRNALQIMRLSKNNLSTADEALDILDRQVRHMTRLVDDLLDMSRITRDKIELRKQRIDISEVVKAAIETSRPLIDAVGHTLTVTMPTRPVVVEADPTRLAQVFSNLLNNAAKYTPRGGKICVQAAQEDEEVLVAVRDNGVGIDCEHLATVFDMFRQVDQSLERSQGGLGIGLTLVRSLVELHGGRVNALSEGLGKGSEFTVRLPLAPALNGPQLCLPAPNGRAQKKRRVLVVDDNHDAASTLCLFLRIKGHDAQVAHNGVQAVELAQQYFPDMILMDVGMPDMDGYEATRRIHVLPEAKHIPIIALTGWGQPEDIQRSLDAGCSAHLVKPVDFGLLERLMLDSNTSTT